MKLRGPVGWLNLLLDGVFVFFSTHTLKNWRKWFDPIWPKLLFFGDGLVQPSRLSFDSFGFKWWVSICWLQVIWCVCLFFSCSLRDPANWWGKFIEIWFWLAVYASICMVLFTLDILGGATCTISVWYFWLYITLIFQFPIYLEPRLPVANILYR